MPGGKRGNRNRKLQSCCVIFVGTENCKNSCRIYVGSPPHNTTINTRHTAPHQPNTNHHQQPQTPPLPPPLPITATNTHPTQPTQPNPAHQAEPSTPSPASRPPVLLVARALGASFWRHFGQHRQPASQSASGQRPAASGQPGQPVAGSRPQPAASSQLPAADSRQRSASQPLTGSGQRAWSLPIAPNRPTLSIPRSLAPPLGIQPARQPRPFP